MTTAVLVSIACGVASIVAYVTARHRVIHERAEKLRRCKEREQRHQRESSEQQARTRAHAHMPA